MLTIIGVRDMVSMGMPANGIQAQRGIRAQERAHQMMELRKRGKTSDPESVRIRRELIVIAKEYTEIV